MTEPKFADIDFQYTDAENERIYAPELIRKAFVDVERVLTQVKLPQKFIVYGPKGSGKSALATKLLFMSEEDPTWLVNIDNLESFEFPLLLKTGGARGSSSIGGSLSVWKMLLHLRILSLLVSDPDIRAKNPDLLVFYDSLREHGFVGAGNIVKISEQTSRKGFYRTIRQALDVEAEAANDVLGTKSIEKDPAAVSDALELRLRGVQPGGGSYYVILDGLDYTLRQNRANTYFMVDLVSAVKHVNEFFGLRRIRAKVLILMREEVLASLPDPNMAKKMNDNGIFLSWYDNVREPERTSLLEVVRRRAELAGFSGTTSDLLRSWMPPAIHGQSLLSFVLDNTRFLPRDVISVFRELQKLGKPTPFSERDVLAALKNYSHWFYRELSDSVVGLVSEPVRGAIGEIFSELGREFDPTTLRDAIAARCGISQPEAEQNVRELFKTSWIGQFWKTKEGSDRFEWKHRNPHAALQMTRGCVLHKGLWKTLNLI